MEIGIAMIVAMAVLMGAMFFGGHGMHKWHKKEKPPVEASTAPVQNSPVPVDSGSEEGHPH